MNRHQTASGINGKQNSLKLKEVIGKWAVTVQAPSESVRFVMKRNITAFVDPRKHTKTSRGRGKHMFTSLHLAPQWYISESNAGKDLGSCVSRLFNVLALIWNQIHFFFPTILSLHYNTRLLWVMKLFTIFFIYRLPKNIHSEEEQKERNLNKIKYILRVWRNRKRRLKEMWERWQRASVPAAGPCPASIKCTAGVIISGGVSSSPYYHLTPPPINHPPPQQLTHFIWC